MDNLVHWVVAVPPQSSSWIVVVVIDMGMAIWEFVVVGLAQLVVALVLVILDWRGQYPLGAILCWFWVVVD